MLVSSVKQRQLFYLEVRCHLPGESKLAKMGCSGSLSPHFANSNYVTAEIIRSTARAPPRVVTWLPVVFGGYIWAPPKETVALLLCHSCVRWVSHGGENRACLLLQLLRQPGKNRRVCNSCSFSSLQPLSSRLAYPGFSKQRRQRYQRGKWRHKHDDPQYAPSWSLLWALYCICR